MPLRSSLVRLHRYAGLMLAGFLAVAGITGSIIAFDDELDALLNPSWFRSEARGSFLSPAELVRRVESAVPRARVSYLPLDWEAGRAVALRIEGRGGEDLPYDQVFVDPVNGKVLGGREWGACCFAPSRLMPFLYRLHYSLTLPGVWGVLLMGGVGILWTLDCFIGFALTLPRAVPRWKKWAVSWRVKFHARRFRLCFDLHRATGLWLWAVLLVLASSGAAMNLPDQVFRPVVSLFSRLAPSFDQLARARYREHPGAPKLSYDEAIALAGEHAANAGWRIKLVYAFHYANYAAYGVGFVRDGEDGASGLGPSRYFFDDQKGTLIREEIAGAGSAGDVYTQAQYPLHTGRILGMTGRVLVCGAGLATAGLSITGVYVWLRKKRSRRWQKGGLAALPVN
jgi:uncharacterized iron-regulated membrane protein